MRKDTGPLVGEPKGATNVWADTATYKIATHGDYIQNNGSKSVLVP